MQKSKTINVSISIPVEIPDLEGVSTEAIQRMLGYYFTDWSDGRYPFSVELWTKATRDCVNVALRQVVEQCEEKKYPGVMIPFESEDGKSSGATAKWVITSSERLRDIYIYSNTDKIKVKVI